MYQPTFLLWVGLFPGVIEDGTISEDAMIASLAEAT